MVIRLVLYVHLELQHWKVVHHALHVKLDTTHHQVLQLALPATLDISLLLKDKLFVTLVR